jgi:16S rRNA (guanine527-N7)-methyltransferase
MSWHLIKNGGALLAMKGENAAAEMEGVPGARLHEISLEGIEPARIVEVPKGA